MNDNNRKTKYRVLYDMISPALAHIMLWRERREHTHTHAFYSYRPTENNSIFFLYKICIYYVRTLSPDRLYTYLEPIPSYIRVVVVCRQFFMTAHIIISISYNVAIDFCKILERNFNISTYFKANMYIGTHSYNRIIIILVYQCYSLHHIIYTLYQWRPLGEGQDRALLPPGQKI